MTSERSLSIGMVGQRGVPASHGGIERAVEELGARLADRGHDVTVYCRRGYSDPNLRTYRGMRLRHLPAPNSKYLEALVHSGLATVAALARRHDVVHFHALGPGVFSPLARIVPRTAVVQTIQGLDDQRAKWGGAASRLLRIGKVLSAHVPNATVVVSRALADDYRVHHQRVTTYIPNGVTLAELPTRCTYLEQLGLEPQGYVLFVGRLVPEKRPELLVEAFRGCTSDARLVLAGGTSHTDDYVAMVRDLAAQDERVVLPGYVYGDDLAQLYANAAVFVLPSDLEGLLLALLEAIGFGVPVIVSDIEPHCEVVAQSGPGGRVIPRGDRDALTAAIDETLADHTAAQVGAARLRSAVLERFDWDKVADDTERLYRSLVTW